MMIAASPVTHKAGGSLMFVLPGGGTAGGDSRTVGSGSAAGAVAGAVSPGPAAAGAGCSEATMVAKRPQKSPAILRGPGGRGWTVGGFPVRSVPAIPAGAARGCEIRPSSPSGWSFPACPECDPRQQRLQSRVALAAAGNNLAIAAVLACVG